MNTFLFVTRPKYSPEEVDRTWSGWWSCSSSTRTGDIALVYVATQGICYEWEVCSDAKRDDQWKFICRVQFRASLDPPITIGELKNAFDRQEWAPPHLHFRGFRSIRLDARIADHIRSLRLTRREPEMPPLAEEITETPLFEGAVRSVNLNAYERNAKARADCIAIYGHTCSVCSIDFRTVYGNPASGFIHVHHVRPMTTVTQRYVVNPRDDLRPVCPNCHAVIHLRNPPYTIDEVRKMVRQASAQQSDAPEPSSQCLASGV